MKVTETSIDKFFASNNTTFAIPVYQRNYDWTRTQCQQLFDDILAVGKNDDLSSHFIGSIVNVLDDVYTASDISELMIIDGQQRLTTLTLIFIALARHAADTEKNLDAERITETYLINKYADEAEKLKLKPTDNNKAALRQIMDPDEAVKSEGYSRIIENFRFFQDSINDSNFDIVQHGLRKLIFVDIALDRQKDNPQRIFESLNSTGLELSQADLIRNYILMKLPRDEQEQVFRKYWEPIEKNARNLEVNKSLVSDFIRDFLTLKQKEIPNKNAVYEKFKKHYPNPSSSELKEALDELREFSYLYACLINPGLERDEVIGRELDYIHRLEVNVAHPFLLSVYRDFKTKVISSDIFEVVLRLVQSYVWRRSIVGAETKALNKVFMNLYDRISPEEYVLSIERSLMQRVGSARFPKDTEVVEMIKKKEMYQINKYSLKYFFDRLENHKNPEFVDITNPSITIEHIFPQKPDPDWHSDLSQEEFDLLQNEYLNTIGNLTLSGSNASLSNKTFREKRDLIREDIEKGYKYSRLWLNRDLANLEKWDVEEVRKRADRIIRRALEVWPAPKVDTEKDAVNEEINIFDAEPRHQSLEYAIFSGHRLRARNFRRLYQEVFKQLLERFPESFHGTNLGDRINLTSNPSDVRTALEVAEEYFIEGKLDATTLFGRMKFALEELDLEDELFIKFK